MKTVSVAGQARIQLTDNKKKKKKTCSASTVCNRVCAKIV